MNPVGLRAAALVLDSSPGTIARVDVLRGGRAVVIDLRVRELDISPLV